MDENALPLVTVVIPTYNRHDLVVQTIASVLGQTYENFEILVVDDGSTDNTSEVIEAISDGRVRYIRRENAGFPAAPRNTGIQQAQGKYIAFLDSDDLWLPEKLQCQIDVMESRAHVNLVYCQAVPFYGSTDVLGDPWPDPKVASSGRVFESLAVSNNFMPCLTVMIRRSVLDQTGLFDEDPGLKGAEDFDLWLRIAYLSEVYFIPQVLALYREHEKGISKVQTTQCRSWLRALDKLEEKGWMTSVELKEVRSHIYWQMGRPNGRFLGWALRWKARFWAFWCVPSLRNACKFGFFFLPRWIRGVLKSSV